MDRSQLAELHYITAIDNVPSMLKLGLLCHVAAEDVVHTSVAMEDIQARRAKKQVPGGCRLHEYVNLYVNGRNIMLSKVLYGASVHAICLLQVSTAVLDLPDVVVTDQNAASDYVRFADASTGLRRIDQSTVFAASWKYPDDQIAEWRHQSAMCAEVLVPTVVDSGFIVGAYVGSGGARRRMSSAAPSLPVILDPYKFFREGM
ncbi:MAG: DUF4433 domain-containing protein [Egibacteraceae bacterium]